MRILVTGVGGPAGQNLVGCLRLAGHEIVGLDANAYHLAAADADQRYLAPATSELRAWLGLVRHLARSVDAILPQPDCDVAALSAHRHLFESVLRLPDIKAVEVCQDKLRTAEVLGDRAVATYPWQETGWRHTGLGLPVWIRARSGAGSRGSMKAFHADQAASWIEYCGTAKGIPRDDFLICEYLPGREFAVQQIWDAGRLVVSQSRERLEYLFGYISPTGQTSSPAVARTVRSPALAELATAAVEAVSERPHGVFGVDIKEDASGQPRVTEINAGRFFTTTLFFATAGLNLPALLLAQTGGTPGMPLVDPLEPDLYWIRTMDRPPQLFRAAEFEDGLAFRTLSVASRARKGAPVYRTKPARPKVTK